MNYRIFTIRLQPLEPFIFSFFTLQRWYRLKAGAIDRFHVSEAFIFLPGTTAPLNDYLLFTIFS
jgi:hypothetical protein